MAAVLVGSCGGAVVVVVVVAGTVVVVELVVVVVGGTVVDGELVVVVGADVVVELVVVGLVVVVVGNARSAAHVLVSTVPVTAKLRRPWNVLTAERVTLPKSPSTFSPALSFWLSWVWMIFTQLPLLPIENVFLLHSAASSAKAPVMATPKRSAKVARKTSTFEKNAGFLNRIVMCSSLSGNGRPYGCLVLVKLSTALVC